VLRFAAREPPAQGMGRAERVMNPSGIMHSEDIRIRLNADEMKPKKLN